MSIINAASPDFGVVQSAIGYAVDGDTVNVAAGSANWGASTLKFSKAITLAGAGIGQTIIAHGAVGMEISVPAPKKYTVAGFEFTGDLGGGFNWMGSPFAILYPSCSW